MGRNKKFDINPVKADKKTRNPKEFTKGDFVLLRYADAEEPPDKPPDKPSPWWYGPFTIRNLCEKGIETLSSVRGGEVVTSVDRLRHNQLNSNDHIRQGYAVMLDDGVT